MNSTTIVRIDRGNPYAVKTVAKTSRDFITREDIHRVYSDNAPGIAGRLFIRRTYRYCLTTRSHDGKFSHEFVIPDPNAPDQYVPAPLAMLIGLEFEINESRYHTPACVSESVERRAMFADHPERRLQCICVNQGCEVVKAPDGSFGYIPYRQSVAV